MPPKNVEDSPLQWTLNPRCALALTLVILTAAVAAREIPGHALPGNPRLALNSSATGTMTYPEGGADSQFIRLRSALLAEWTATRLELALDVQGVHLEDSRQSGIDGFIASTDEAFYRIQPFSTDLGDAADIDWHGELDRAFLTAPIAGGHAKIGRQAVGLGRGVLFSAVDVFAPFSPLDIDREWRRGVDAARWEYRLGSTWSSEIIGIFAESWNDSAAVTRVRGFIGTVDAELILGKRAQDLMIGGDASMALAGAEVHVDAALFNVGDTADRAPDVLPEWVAQTVVGGSYTFDVGNGLTVLAEHTYNGFGESDIEDAVTNLIVSGDYRERFARGDMRILGSQAVGLQASYPLSIDCSAALRWIVNPNDGSGLITPFLSWQVGQRTTILLSLYIPHGEHAGDSGLPRSEYGDTPMTCFAQIRIYD